MVTFRICLYKEWVERSDREAVGPSFLVYRGTEEHRPWHVNVLLDSLHVRTLQNEIGVKGQQNDPQIKHTVLRYVIRRIEQGLREGIFPTPQSCEPYTLEVDETELLALKHLLQEKTCTYQI